jgi:PiT family inorganic phosphate transporter
MEGVTVAGGLAIVGAIGLAALLGVSDAPNATAALVSARTGSYPQVAAWSVLWHVVGGLLAGAAVARTIVGIVHVRPHLAAAVFAAACLTSVVFTWVTTHRGFPVSASVALVGGLAGAGVVAGGTQAVDWGGVTGVRLSGVTGVLAGIVLAPFVAGAVAGVADRLARRLAYRAPRRALGGVHGGLWAASAAVALADGTNDGQKAMGILAVSVAGTASLSSAGGIATWERLLSALVLALFTVLGGRRVVARVSRGLAQGGAVDDLAAQSASAGMILLAGVVGLPLSTSTVVTSAMVGTGVTGRRHHVRWSGVLEILAMWVVTVPASALLAAGVFEILRRLP